MGNLHAPTANDQWRSNGTSSAFPMICRFPMFRGVGDSACSGRGGTTVSFKATNTLARHMQGRFFRSVPDRLTSMRTDHFGELAEEKFVFSFLTEKDH